jgi:anti-sigma factor RsiW
MRCLDVKCDLQAYVDGELGPERIALLERHLANCRGCQAELNRLQTVVTALETWPVVVEPVDLTAQVMTRVRVRHTIPAFRLRWIDLGVSLAGASLVFTALLIWRYLVSANSAYLCRMRMALQLELLWLDVLRMAQRLGSTGIGAWEGLIGGLVVLVILSFALWDLATRHKRTFSM